MRSQVFKMSLCSRRMNLTYILYFSHARPGCPPPQFFAYRFRPCVSPACSPSQLLRYCCYIRTWGCPAKFCVVQAVQQIFRSSICCPYITTSVPTIPEHPPSLLLRQLSRSVLLASGKGRVRKEDKQGNLFWPEHIEAALIEG